MEEKIKIYEKEDRGGKDKKKILKIGKPESK
jgi:hypothetical protein